MPELPEVQTVVNGLSEKIIGKKILNFWTDYNSSFYKNKENIKDPKYFREFKKQLIGQKIISVERRAKNILIFTTNNKVIIIHLKMTGHFLFGKYFFDKKNKIFVPEGGFVDSKKIKKSEILQRKIIKNPLSDPFNKFIHFVIDFGNNQLALSDMRKFASVYYTSKNNIPDIFKKIGPEVFNLNKNNFLEIFKNKKGNIKTFLMNPKNIAGIGNIYSDEILWELGIHPESCVSKIPNDKILEILFFTKKIFKKSISMGGDSMSDFRNIEGKRGLFQNKHNAYKLEKTKCKKKDCCGIIKKKQINQRIGRYCDKHQKKYK